MELENGLFGCVRKESRTMGSRLTNLRPAKGRACLVKLPRMCSIKDKFPPVYHQRYGNCTSNAVLGCDDMIYHGSGVWVPSTTFTYYNQKKGEKPMKDTGSAIEYALKAVKKYGACSVKFWPNEKPFDEKPSKEAYENGLHGHEIKKWYEIKNHKQLKQAIVRGYPVAICMQWAFKFIDVEYVLNTPTKKQAWDAENCHAVVIVGYDDDNKLYEFRNSWGAEWGNNGYGYFTYEAVTNCVIWEDTYAVVA